MVGTLHYEPGKRGNILNIADSADCAGATRGPMHNTGIEFDFPVFVGKSAQADGIVSGVVFLGAKNKSDCIESVMPAAKEFVSAVRALDPGVLGDDDGFL